MRHALINPSNAIDRISGDIDPTVRTRAGWRWLPVVDATPPVVNEETTVLVGPTYVIGATEVTESFSTRAITAGELDTLQTNRALVYKTLVRALYNLHHRLQILEGVPLEDQHTFQQFQNFFKNQMTG